MNLRSAAEPTAGSSAAVAIGIDVGGTSVKAAAVDTVTAELVSSRVKRDTPPSATPEDIADIAAALITEISDELGAATPPPLGMCVPSVMKNGRSLTAANIERSWINFPAHEFFAKRFGERFAILNDADAAGLAELRHGAAKNKEGVTVLLTLGTGIGSALIHNSTLIEGSELGHLDIGGQIDFEKHAAPSVIHKEQLTLQEWAQRLSRYLRHLEILLHPDRFLLGGSISKDSSEFLPLEGVKTPVAPARFLNNAGIIGAAVAAALAENESDR